MRSQSPHCRDLGQSLNEYILPLALISVVGVAALTVMGNQVSSLLTKSITHKSTQAAPVTSVPVGTTPALAQVNIAGSASWTLTNPDGSVMILSNVPNNIPLQIETVGVDGTTKQYAEVLNQLADQLIETNQIDSDTADLIRAMANKGFVQGELLTQLKSSVALSPAKLNSVSTTVTDPEALQLLRDLAGGYTSNPFNNMISPDNPRHNQLVKELADPNTNLNQFSQSMLNFPPNMASILSIYEQLKPKLLSNNPAAKQVIDTAIADMFLVSSRSIDVLSFPTLGPSGVPWEKAVADNIGSVRTDAGNICQTHQANQSTGVSCEPSA